MPLSIFGQDAFNYKKAWEEVNKLQEDRQLRTANEAVADILEAAEKEGNDPQYIKALLFGFKYQQTVTENSDSLIIVQMEQELNQGSPIRQAILNSFLAQMYYQYLANNRWRIMQRTELTEKAGDFQTWDLKTFVKTINDLHFRALDRKEILKDIPVEDYEVLLVRQEGSEKYRPSLYDILAQAAISYFNESGLLMPESKEDFELKASAGNLSVQDFIRYNFQSSDDQNATFNIIKLYQDLTTFHYTKENLYALYDVTLKRLEFVKNHTNDQNGYKTAIEGLTGLALKHPVEGDIKLALAEIYNKLKDNTAIDASEEERQSSKVKALSLCEDIIKNYPKTNAAINAEVLKIGILRKEMSLTGEDYVTSGEASRILLNYTNLNKTYFRLIALTEKLKKDIAQLQYSKEEKLATLFRKQRVLKSWTSKLPGSEDHFDHQAEIAVPALAGGEYLVLVSDNSAFSIKNHAIAYLEHRVSDLSHIYYLHEFEHHYFLLDRSTGEPLKNVTAQVYRADLDRRGNFGSRRNEPKLAETLKTDNKGGLVIKRKYERERVYVIFKKGKESWKAEGQDIYYYNNRNKNTKERRQVNIFTDRAIYRPGQTVYFKAILTGRIDQSKPYIIKNQTLRVTFYDANRQKISEQDLQTNEYGSLNGSFVAPTGGLNGRMTIQTLYGSQYISVEDYKRPTFEVKVDTVEGNYKFGDEVELSGNAEAYSGAAISNATVKFRVIRARELPYWYYWRRTPVEPEKEIVNGTAQTDDKGKFTLKFIAEPGKSAKKPGAKPIYNYKVVVDVVDISGETRSATAGVRISEKSLEVKLKASESISLKDPESIGVVTNNLNGKFVPTKGTIKIIPLEMPEQTFRKRRWNQPDQFVYSEKEFRKLFPHDLYKDENEFYNWAEGDPILEQEFETAEGKSFSIDSLKEASPGKYKVVFITKDEEEEAQSFFTLYDPEEKVLPTPTLISWSSNPNSVEPGQTAILEFKTTEKKIWVLYQLMKSNEILDEKWIELKKGSSQIEVPITEEHRGNLSWQIGFVYRNEYFNESGNIIVPWTNKQLKLEWMSFRSPLQPGQKEQWKLKISGPKADAVASEMVATLYDASLDEFAAHNWIMNLYPTYYGSIYKRSTGFGTDRSGQLDYNWNRSAYGNSQRYDRLNFHGFYFGNSYLAKPRMLSGMVNMDAEADGVSMAAAPMEEMSLSNKVQARASVKRRKITPKKGLYSDEKLREKNEALSLDDEKAEDLPLEDGNSEPITPRRNLNETAFFLPKLRTNEAGEIIIEFTIPEALTKWKFLGLAHTQDLKVGKITGETVTQKELMVVPNLPRFFREGDKMTLTAKVINMTDSLQVGTAELKLFNAFNMKAVDGEFAHNMEAISVSIPPKGSEVVSWEINVPKDRQAIAVQVFARTAAFTDGQENIIPVLTNRMLVTESIPFAMKSKEKKKKIEFVKLKNSGSSATLTHHKLTLDVTSNPAWYAVQALPYLMEYPYECTEQVFSRFYANALATNLANDKPMIKQVFDQWKSIGSEESFLSNLEKNQELKNALLEETPWVLQAKNESERKKRLGLLFDLNRMADEFSRTKKILSERQNGTGGFSWFPGMGESRYITQLIATGMGHLRQLGVSDVSGNPEISIMMEKAVQYLDREILDDYRKLKKIKGIDMEANHLGYSQIQYLYMRSFYTKLPMDIEDEAYNYYYGQAKTYWNKQSTYMNGMLALVFQRNEDKELARKLIRGLDESAVKSSDKGMYWKDNNGWFWWEAPIEKQALLIEAFMEISDDQDAIDDMRYWLLINKRTNDWETTRATVAACNALLQGGSEWLDDQQLVEVKLGDVKVEAEKIDKIEAGTGQYQVSWTGSEIEPKMGNIQVKKPGKSPAWGGVFWQYFEDLDKITFAETPLSIRKTLNKEVITPKGAVLKPIKEAELKQGDKIVVRIELRVNQAMEYVHMKDMRAAGLEPINVISRYKYQGGLGYYESTRDAATNFFFGYLPEGTWVFEYPLRVNLPGDFSNGITTIQCMYAPEFTSHSSGERVEIQP
ncbi:MAG: MG2 domain-containing protein [Bacteroidia bacterium]|nr:MG2 domain-containing protein [Bacteroidia bacterium]